MIGAFAGAIVPGILAYAMPLSFLIGTMVAMSGLSGESQIVALRSCGVPLRRLLWPLLALALLAAGVTGLITNYLVPRTALIISYLKYRVNIRQLTSQIQPRVFNEGFPDLVFYLDDLALDRQKWSRVFVADNSDPGGPRIILARQGSWITDRKGTQLQLNLEDGRVYQVDPNDPTRDNMSVFDTTDIPVAVRGLASANGRAMTPLEARRPAEMSTSALWRPAAAISESDRRDQRIELHRRITLPFSALAFAIIALPLGAGSRRTGRTAGFVIGLLLVLLFYTSLMNGIRLASVGRLPPWLGAWGANLILLAVGAALFWSTERSFRLVQWFGDRRWRALPSPAASPALSPNGNLRGPAGGRRGFGSFCSRFARRCVPKILDYYVGRGFLTYLLWSAVACGALFVVLTMFELLDDIVRNDIPAIIVADYLFSLLPQILILILPIAVLLATLIHFGILEKASEITAIKAGGWSLYRLAMPVVIMAMGVCAGLYLLQDYVLPYANMRQDSLRNLIKGRPAQTLRPQRKWIFGESGRIFNYDYFDAGRDIFVRLNVFEIDFQGLQIARRIHAEQATIDRSGTWILERGWVHDFRPESPGFETIDRGEFDFPEKAGYFRREIFDPRESAKLTYLELRQYISYLQKSGYNATELQVELYKKLSFPLSSLVMALVGVPFSFSMGRRGAFFGIGASIVIAIVYWGTFSIFEAMGSYGLLIPALAAWAPNVLFGATGLALLLKIRT